MSFIDLMASDVWSATDIDNKVQALIRSRYSQNDELKAARLARSGDDADFVAAVDGWIAHCVQEGRDARADMALLLQVLDLEVAHRRLLLPVLEPEVDEAGNVLNQEALEQDAAERAAAQVVMDAGSAEALALFELRNPPPPPQEQQPAEPETALEPTE